MHIKKILLILLLLYYSVSLAQAADDTKEIQQLIDDNTGGTVQLEAKTYTVTQFTIPDNTILKGASENGKPATTIKLKNECGLGRGVPVVPIDYGENIEICYIKWDGNQDNQKYVPVQPGTSKRWGQQYNTFIYAQYSKNIHVHHCDFYNNLGDGLRISYCENVEFDHNTGSMGGHDTFFGLRSEGLDIHDNNVNPLVNSAIRILDCSHVRIYDNYIEWIGPRDAGPGIQIQHDSGTMEDIEVCNNVIISSWGSGLWLVGKTSGGEDLWLHHNLFLNCGKNYGIYWVGGIIASGYDNALIENNVFDGSYLGAINFYAVNAGWATSATATLKENVFTNSIPNKKDKTGGWGVNNQISKQEIVSSSNCYWNNKAGDVRGCSVSGSDLFIDPKEHETPSGWIWTGTEWQCDSVKPSEMGDYTRGTYDDTEPLTDEEIEEFESIFEIFNVELCTTVSENHAIVLPEGIKSVPSSASGTVEYYKVGDNYTTFIHVPAEGLSEVTYEVHGAKTTHTIMIGERTNEGVVFTEASVWEGDLSHDLDSLKMPGKVEIEDIKVTCVTPRGKFEPELKTVTTEFKPVKFHPAAILLILVFLIACVFIRMSLKHML